MTIYLLYIPNKRYFQMIIVIFIVSLTPKIKNVKCIKK